MSSLIEAVIEFVVEVVFDGVVEVFRRLFGGGQRRTEDVTETETQRSTG